MTAVNIERLLFLGRHRPLRVETVSLIYWVVVAAGHQLGRETIWQQYLLQPPLGPGKVEAPNSRFAAFSASTSETGN